MDIRINGVPFELWESATIKRSIDNNCGVFRFTNSSTVPGAAYPVKAGDLVNILVDGVTKVSGFVDQVSVVSDDRQHTINVSGRDRLADLIDSTTPDAAKVQDGPISLKKLCENVIAGLGASIPVIDQVEPQEFSTEDLQASGSGDNAMEFLNKFARKRQVYLVSDGLGSLIIFRPSRAVEASPLIRKLNGVINNVMVSETTISDQNRFNRVLCRSADNFGFDNEADYSGDGVSREGFGIDPAIRASRFLEIQAEESMDDAECLERAKEEVNIRRARSVQYVATVAGFSQNDGTLWDFGQFVPVNDDYANVIGQMLIRSIDMSLDIRRGSRTKIVCATTDAYQVTDERPIKDARKSKVGEEFS